ncbi:PRC-barrel domain-containing protein [Roseomonas xinghualingensis]|uniref:PRC-barrel domain-containing protein n=1 Tax=Roseomonas xinghualingensis TaxID=2986475 RepID=UPI0021F23AFC|nr:PRC-barrel domain-containing protein [Roseomonas sp. SXEYE001]MCV4207032.1 PRC-barrel domain-containing protein [Roseomonas sp. SXEYE001]
MRAQLHPCARRLALILGVAAFPLAPVALAQDQPATPPPAAEAPAAPPSSVPPASTQAPAAREELPREAARRVIGREVTGPSGAIVGLIVNVLMDESGQPRAAVLDYGGFLGVGRRRVAVAWRTLRFLPEIVRLELTRDQIRAFPDYKEGESVVIAAPPAAEAPAESAPEAGPATSAEAPPANPAPDVSKN